MTIYTPLILKVQDITFFMWAKHIKGPFKGFFKELETFLAPYIGPGQSKGWFWGQKSQELKGPIMHALPKFKKIMSHSFRIKGAKVFLWTCSLHSDNKSSKMSQSQRKTPQNRQFCTVPTGESIN